MLFREQTHRAAKPVDTFDYIVFIGGTLCISILATVLAFFAGAFVALTSPHSYAIMAIGILIIVLQCAAFVYIKFASKQGSN